MRIIAFITDAPTVRDRLAHLGEPSTPPPSPRPAARRCGQRPLRVIDSIPPEDASAPPPPAYAFDQRIAW